MYMTMTLVMYRVVAERVTQASWAWGHSCEEGVGAQLLSLQGGDNVCFPFRVMIVKYCTCRWTSFLGL